MQFTPEQREEYRRHKGILAYDRLVTAQSIIRDAYRKAHPHARWNASGMRDGILTCGYPIKHHDTPLMLDAAGHEHHDHKSCSSWACPVCAARMANRRAKEIEQALVGANRLGYQCLFLTFTVPHRKSHSTSYVLDRLDTCYHKLIDSQKVRKLKAEHGFVGQIKCKDYTVGENGIHAHLHCIWIFEDKGDPYAAASEINAIVEAKWDRIVFNETGKHASKKHGFDLEIIELGNPDAADAAKIARYAAKAISVYMSEGEKGKASKTPFDFLNADATEEDRAAYLDFYKGQKGKHHISFSRGLKTKLNVGCVEESTDGFTHIAWLTYENAYLLKDASKRYEFEARAASSVNDALAWLEAETAKQQRELAYDRLGLPQSYRRLKTPEERAAWRDANRTEEREQLRIRMLDRLQGMEIRTSSPVVPFLRLVPSECQDGLSLFGLSESPNRAKSGLGQFLDKLEMPCQQDGGRRSFKLVRHVKRAVGRVFFLLGKAGLPIGWGSFRYPFKDAGLGQFFLKARLSDSRSMERQPIKMAGFAKLALEGGEPDFGF